MAGDKLRIDIDVSAAKAGLDSLSKSFASMRTSAQGSINAVSASVSKLNAAMANIKVADTSGLVSSIDNLRAAMSGIDASPLAAASTAVQQLVSAASGLQGAASSLSSMAKSLQGLQSSAGGASGLAAGFSKTGQAAAQADAHVRAFARSQAQTQAAVKALGVELFNSAGYIANLGVSAGNVIGRFTELSARGLSVAQVFSQLQNTFGSLGTAGVVIGGLALAMTTLYSVTSSLVAPVLEVGTAFNNFKLAVDALDGSGAGAATLEKLQKVATDTGNSVLVLAKSYTGFRAAAQAAGVSANASMEIYSNMSTGLRALGADSVRTEKAMLAMTQMFSKGKIQAEELRGQLGDALPGAMSYMAAALGKTTSELEAMLRAGTLLAAEALPKLGEFMKLKFGDAVAAQIQSASGQMALFQNAVDNLTNSLYQGIAGGVGRGFAAGLAAINQALDSSAIRTFVGVIGDLGGALLAVVGGAIGGFINGLTAGADAVLGIASSILGLVSPLVSLTQYFQNSGIAMQVIGGAAKALGAALGVLASAFIASKAAALVSSAAMTVWATVTGTAAGASVRLSASVAAVGASAGGSAAALGVFSGVVTAVTGAVARLSAVLRVNPMVMWGSLIAGVAITLYDLVGGFDGLTAKVGSLIGVSGAAASGVSGIDGALARLTKTAASSASTITQQAQSYFTLEGSQKRVSQETTILEDKLRALQLTQAQQTSAMDQARNAHNNMSTIRKQEIQTLEAEQRAIERSESKWKDLGVATDGSSEKLRNVKDAITVAKEAMQDANLAFEERMQREKEFAQDLVESENRLRAQKELLASYGQALNDNGLAMAQQIEAFGKTKEEAGQLALAYQEGIRGITGQAAALREAASAQIDYAKFMQDQAKAVEAVIQADEQRLAAAGRTKEEIAQLTAAQRTHLETLKGQVVGAVESAGAQLTLATAIGEGKTVSEAAAKVAGELKDQFGAQVDPLKLSADAMNTAAKAAGANKDASTTAGDAAKTLGEKSAESTKSIDAAATSSEKAATAFGTVSTAMQTAQTSFTTAGTSLQSISQHMNTFASGVQTAGIALPVLSTALTELPAVMATLTASLTTLKEPLQAVSGHLASSGPNTDKLRTALEELLPIVGAMSEPMAKIGEAFSTFAPASAAIDATKTAMTSLVEVLAQSKDPLNEAVSLIAALGEAAKGVKKGFEAGKDGSETFKRALEALTPSIDATIGKLDQLRKAAEKALKAAQAASGGGATGDTSAPAQREGGYAGDRLASQSVSAGAFDNAPAFASGTTNTSKYLSKVSGGGIPSILHPNEAVIPLSRGREVPVALDMSMDASAGNIDLSPLSALERSLRSLTNSLDRPPEPSQVVLTAPTVEPIVEVNLGDFAAPAYDPPIVPPQATRYSSDGLSAGSNQTDTGSSADSRTDSGTRDNTGRERSRTANVTININAADVDSFNRSKDQLYRELDRRVNRANRRSRN